MAGSYNLGTAEGLIRIKYDGTGAGKAQEDFKKTEASATRSGGTLTGVGNKSALAAGVLAAGLAYVTNKAVDFEKQISAIGAVSGASTADLESMRKKALQLGADTTFSASQAANAMEELAKAGISVPDILNGAADAAVALAAAGGIALPEAATISANAMNSFGIAAKDLVKVADQIAGAANASAIDVGEFGQSLQQVGAVAHLAGISFNDTAVAIALMGNAGIKGSDAGTSLKTMLQNLIPQTKQQIQLFHDLGIITKDGANHFFDASGKARSLADISQVLQNALKGMSKEQQLATLQTIFGSDAIRAAAVLANQGAAGFNSMATAIGKTSAADVAAARLDNTAGKLEALKGSAETAAIAFGTALLPALLSTAKSLTSFANFLASLGPGTITIILRIVSAIAGFLVIVSIIAKIVEAIKLFKAAWIALNLQFIATPIGAVITLIVLLVAAFIILWIKCAGFRNFFIGAWNAIWGVLKAIGAWFAGPFANFFIGAWNVIMAAFNAVKGPVMAVFNFIMTGITGVWQTVSAIIGFFAPLFQSVFGLIVSIVKFAWAVISAVFQVAFAIITPIVQLGMLLISGAIQAALWVIMGIWNFVWNGLKGVIILVWSWIGPYVMGAILVIQTIIQGALQVISAVWSAVWSAIRTVVTVIWGLISNVVRSAVATIVGIIDGIRAIVDKVRGFFNQLKDAAKGGIDGLITFVAGIAGRILGAIGDAGHMLFDVGKKIIQGMLDGIKSMAQAAVDAVKNVLKGARDLLPFSPAKKGPFSGRGWTLYSGQAMVEAMAAGILRSRDTAVAAMQTTISSVANVSAVGNSPLMSQFQFNPNTAGLPTGASTVTNNYDIDVNVPAPVDDPKQIADYTVKKINTSLSTNT
jgi:TP901 family phage tail tape measure protein